MLVAIGAFLKNIMSRRKSKVFDIVAITTFLIASILLLIYEIFID
jgi:hypothetical protein